MRISDWSSDVCSSDLPCPCIAGQPQLLPGACDMIGIEIGTFDQHVGGAVDHARILAAHDAADIVRLHVVGNHGHARVRSEEHTSELQSLMRISYAVFCLKKKKNAHSTMLATTSLTQQHNRAT